MKRKSAIKPLHLEVLVNAARRLVEACTKNNLDCRDPPLASTRFLYSLGYTQYLIRSLWKKLSEPIDSIALYKYENAVFNLSVEHSVEALCSLEYNGLFIPLDAMDSLHLRHGGHNCLFTPRTHVIRVYLKGSVLDHVEIRINIIRLLSIIAKGLGLGKVYELLDGIIELLWNRDVRSIESELLEFFHHDNYERILSFFLPHIPRDLEDLLRVSPVLRRLHT
ncbi:MAG: hypothetical protein F7C37_06690 [Desulfurococcales archaeon]|nr:hypothetical protein [Desulfurococcales archaeon]MCE4626849.1 hypothetical protein [Desulfurococcales archaeon]